MNPSEVGALVSDLAARNTGLQGDGRDLRYESALISAPDWPGNVFQLPVAERHRYHSGTGLNLCSCSIGVSIGTRKVVM